MIKNLIGDDEPLSDEEAPPNSSDRPSVDILGVSNADPEVEAAARPEPFILSKAPPESFAETTRKNGLAWSAGIAFFASVVFMMVIGWLADLLLGSSPWGIVGGIILGSLIGFVQFFRITSQIFKN